MKEYWQNRDINDLEGEVWKSLDFMGYPNYAVSNLGRVKFTELYKWDGTCYTSIRSMIKNQNLLKNGYIQVHLHNKVKRAECYIHRLVAMAFIPNPEGKSEVDHIDTNPRNNCVDNLRWATSQENSNNPLTRKKLSGENNWAYGMKGKAHFSSIPIVQLTMDGKLVREWDSISDAQRELGRAHISCCCHGRRPHSLGYRWMFRDEYYGGQVVRKYKSIVQLSLNGDYIRTWDSASEASKGTGLKQTCISRCCKGTQGRAGHFKWLYADDYRDPLFVNLLDDFDGKALAWIYLSDYNKEGTVA